MKIEWEENWSEILLSQHLTCLEGCGGVASALTIVWQGCDVYHVVLPTC